MSDLLFGRLARLTTAIAGPDAAYLRSIGVDVSTAEVIAGCLTVNRTVPSGSRMFDFDESGGETAIIEALAEDSETVLDLVAWRPDAPHRWRTYLDAAPALGMAAALNPTTYLFDEPLRLFRSPSKWLQAGGAGVVILEPLRGARWLLDLSTIATTIAAEDDAHAAEVAAARRALFEEQALVVPVETAA